MRSEAFSVVGVTRHSEDGRVGRIRVDRHAQLSQPDSIHNGERYLRDEVTGLVRDDGRAHDVVSASPQMNLYESADFSVGDGTINGPEVDAYRVQWDVLVARILYAQPDVRDLRVCVNTTRNDQSGDSLAPHEERVLEYDARRGVCHVRVLPFRADISRRVDAGVRRAQEVVDVYSGLLIPPDVALLQIEFPNVGNASSADEQVVERFPRFLVGTPA